MVIGLKRSAATRLSGSVQSVDRPFARFRSARYGGTGLVRRVPGGIISADARPSEKVSRALASTFPPGIALPRGPEMRPQHGERSGFRQRLKPGVASSLSRQNRTWRRRWPQPNQRDEPRPISTGGRRSPLRSSGTSPHPQSSKQGFTRRSGEGHGGPRRSPVWGFASSSTEHRAKRHTSFLRGPP